MKTPGNDLFELIKALNKTEKGYFKRHSAIDIKGKSTKYNLLFDAVNDQKEYDERSIIHKHRQHAFTRQFGVAKIYLFNRILKAMHSYHSSIYEDIRSQLHYVEILQEKGLYGAAEKIIRKTKQTAVKFDLLFYMPAILRNEYILASENYDLDRMEKIAKEGDHYLGQLQNTNSFRILSQSLNALVLQAVGKMTEKQRRSKVERIIRNPLLKKETNATNFSSLLCYYDLFSTYWYYKKDNSKCLHFAGKKFDLFNKNLEKIPYQLHEYFICANNVLYLYLAEKEFPSFEKSLEQLKSIFPLIRSTAEKGYHFSVYYTNYLSYIGQTGQFEKIRRSLPVIQKEYSHYESELAEMEKVELNLHFAVCCFGLEKYEDSLRLLNKIQNDLSVTSHEYIARFIRLFYIIVHIEKENDELVEHLVQSTYRQLHQNPATKFERLFIDFLKTTWIKGVPGNKLEEKLHILKKKALALYTDKNEKLAFEFFNYIAWIESKLEKRSYSFILNKKLSRDQNI